MMIDYISILTEDDEMRALMLQGVESCRRLYPNFKKATLTKCM